MLDYLQCFIRTYSIFSSLLNNISMADYDIYAVRWKNELTKLHTFLRNKMAGRIQNMEVNLAVMNGPQKV